MDGTQWLSYLSLLISAGALALACAAFKLNRDAPVKEQQRLLRADVLADAERLSEMVQESELAAGYRDPLDLGDRRALPLLGWAGRKATRFVDQTVPQSINRQFTPLEKWDRAALEYEHKHRMHAAAQAFMEKSDREDTLTRDQYNWAKGQHDEARHALESAAIVLEQRCEGAQAAVEEIIKTIHRLDKTPD